MILTSIANGLIQSAMPGLLSWAGCVSGWTAALLLLPYSSRILRLQVGIILTLGIVLIIFAIHNGAEFSVFRILNANILLLSMIAAVGFLRLVALPVTDQKESIPRGKTAYIKTLFGVSAFSSFINISAPLIIADQINKYRALDKLTTKSIVRIFCSAASWSPFYGAMAVVLTYTPGSEINRIIVAGLPFALFSLLFVSLEGLLRYKHEIRDFVGFPIQLHSLQVPAILVGCVVLCTVLLSEVSTLTIITLSALLVTACILTIRQDYDSAAGSLKSFTLDGLPGMVNELVLFLVAGVLAAGISGLVQIEYITNPFDQFGTAEALVLLAIMILLSMLCIHPVIQITSFTPLILPLNPDPNLLAVIYLFAWHLGTCSSPLSGTNLVFQGRYGIPSWKGAMWNWPYALVMYLVAIIWLNLIAPILSIA